MNMNKTPWPITTLVGKKDKIDTYPDYQRPAVWSTAQKQQLMDTIIQGYDVPKLYLRQPNIKVEAYEVVDGQQRLGAIFDFVAEKYKLPNNSDPVDGYEIKGMLYTDLPS